MPMQAWCARPVGVEPAGCSEFRKDSRHARACTIVQMCDGWMAGWLDGRPDATSLRTKGVQGAPAAEHACMAHSSSRSHYSFHHQHRIMSDAPLGRSLVCLAAGSRGRGHKYGRWKGTSACSSFRWLLSQCLSVKDALG